LKQKKESNQKCESQNVAKNETNGLYIIKFFSHMNSREEASLLHFFH